VARWIEAGIIRENSIMSHIPNSAMPHARADEPANDHEQQHSRFNTSEWKTWAGEQLARGRDQVGPMVQKVRNDPKLMAAVIGTLAMAALPLLASRRRRHAFG
jgi:hypothetical protein